MAQMPDAFHEQVRCHVEGVQAGEQRGKGWYALLPDNEEEVRRQR